MGAADRIADTLLRIGQIQGDSLSRTGDIQARAMELAAQARAGGVTGSADALARATAANGQIWGQTLAQLGQLPGQVIQQQRQGKIADQEMAMRKLQLDQATHAAAGEKALASNLAGDQLAPGATGPRQESYLGADGLFDVPKITQALASGGYGDIAPSLVKGAESINDSITKHQAAEQQAQDAKAVVIGDMAHTVKTLRDAGVPTDQAMDLASQPGIARKSFTPQEYQQIKSRVVALPDPAQQDAFLTSLMDAANKIAPEKTLSEGAIIPDRYGRAPVATNPKPAPQPTPSSIAVSAAGGDPTALKANALLHPTAEKSPTETTLALDASDPNSPTQARSAAALRLLKPAGAGGMTPDASAKRQDAKTVAQGIKDFVETGEGLSPEILLSSRTTEQGMALNAELRNMGVDTAKLTREWMATKGAIRSLNSASQVRLAEVINKASSSLDKLDELNQQWSSNASRWGVKVLNKASLTAAQNGLYGPEAASVATRLDSQIADVTSELGQGIMGGNSPTDHAFGLASKNLSSDWTQKTLSDSIKQVRYNLNLAQQARNEMLQQVGVTSTQVQTPAPASATAPGMPPPGAKVRVWNPKTGKLE